MPSLSSTGPAKINVGFDNTKYGVDFYLGQCEEGPSIQVPSSYTPLFADFASKKIPSDWLYDGLGPAKIILDINRINFGTLGLLIASHRRNFPSPNPDNNGIDPRLSRGSLVNANKTGFQLSIEYTAVTRNSPFVNDYAQLEFGSAGRLIPGYAFFQCFIDDIFPDNIGVNVYKVRLSITATPYRILKDTSIFRQGDFVLYSTRKEHIIAQQSFTQM